jgi:hypothetical protein
MSWQHRSRCARRLSTLLVMCLGLAVSLSAALAQGEPTFGEQSSRLNVNKPAHFQIWRTITLGTYKGVDAYRDAMDSGELKLAFLPTKSSAGPRFLMQK